MSEWLNWVELKAKITNKKVVCWGCFEYLDKTLNYLNLKPDFIVDINKHLHGAKRYNGFDVFDPTKILNSDSKNQYFIIITSTAFLEITSILSENEFISGVDFCVTPALNNNKVISEIFNVDQDIIFSSSDAIQESPAKGGGLYTLNTRSGQYKKVVSGVTRGFEIADKKIFVADASLGIRVLNAEYKDIDLIKLDDDAYPHGLTIDIVNKKLYVVLTRFDRIDIFDIDSYQFYGSIRMSKFSKDNNSKKYFHHINDIHYNDSSLYVSMFSISGNNNFLVDDGGVLEYSVENKTFIGQPFSGLWRPHSVKIIDQELHILDSMRGTLRYNSIKVGTTFNGFVRGLDRDASFYYIGQSTHRYFDRLVGLSNNISVDCGIYIFDPVSHATRFLPTPTLRDINTLKVHCL
jgi:hypothetical protein